MFKARFALSGALMLSAALLAQTPQSPPGAAGAQAPAPGAGRGGGFTHPEPLAFDTHDGWQSIFDGTLKDWDGDTTVWRVERDELIAEGTRVAIYNVGHEGAGMYGLGIPSDLEQFLADPVSLRAVA